MKESIKESLKAIWFTLNLFVIPPVIICSLIFFIAIWGFKEDTDIVDDDKACEIWIQPEPDAVCNQSITNE